MVASHSDAGTIPGILRDTVSFPRLPWLRPLVEAVAHDFASVAPLFAGNPADARDWASAIARVQHSTHDRDAVASLLVAQMTKRGAPAAAINAAGLLARPDAVAVVTGQQAGIFGGPLYTLLKAVTTVQLARAATATHGTPVVPVFWVDGDDHDWDEVRVVHVLDASHGVTSLAANDPPGAGARPVGSLTLDESIADTITALGATLPPTEFTGTLVDLLRKHYRAGASPSTACAGWLDELLGSEGLVVFDASDPAAKPLAAAVFQRELAHPCRTARLAREGGEQVAAAGHAAQIVPGDDVVCLFRIDDDGRLPIRCRDGQFTVNDAHAEVSALSAEAAAHPERFSPNVLLRPIIQDTLFPTICYVAGPSELAYHAQLGGVYRAFGVERPLVACRASASVIDSAAARFLERNEVAFESLQVQDESALNRLLESQLPASVDAAFDDIERQIGEWTDRLRIAAAAVDPTLAGAADSTATRMRETVKNLQGKIVQAAKKKNDTVRRQFIRTQALLFPHGHAQERFLNVAFFINRYGPDLGARLIDALPLEADRHYIVVP